MRYKIAYVSTYDARDIGNWSGTPFFMGQLLERSIGDVTYINSMIDHRSLIQETKHILYRLCAKKGYFADRSEAYGRHYAEEIHKRVKSRGFDLIFAHSTIPVAFLETDIPIVLWTDATFRLMVDYYFTNICQETIDDGNRMEQLSFEKCMLTVFPSRWAAESAAKDYSVPESKIEIIQFGANLFDIPDKQDLKLHFSKPLELLFVGKEWERKGGDIVYETLYKLAKCGIAAHLSIVGSEPPLAYDPERITVYPFLDKKKKSDLDVLYRLYHRADFLLLPSHRECAGIVLAEASAFGSPVLVSNTGGIPSMVKEGRNGFIMPLDATGVEYAKKIMAIIADKSYYASLCRSTRAYYDEIINWNTAAMRLRDAIHRRME
jgi:glycosyltransferase involved in cell wall biosynthesis